MPKFILFAISLLFLYSCQNSKVTGDRTATENFEILYISEYGGLGIDQTEIISDNKEWPSLWQELTFQPAESAPEFDSEISMVVRKDFQSRQTGGNQYGIESVRINGNRVDIDYSVSSSEMATDAVTSPLILVKIKKVDKPDIRFNLIAGN